VPIHRVPRASLHEDLLEITRRQGERIKSVMPDPFDPERYMVLTDYLGVETRPAEDVAL
jgi:hypothetical protein